MGMDESRRCGRKEEDQKLFQLECRDKLIDAIKLDLISVDS